MRTLIVTTLLLMLGMPAAAQICPGDSLANQSLTSNDVTPMRVKIWSRTKLIHGPSHASCAGIVGTNAVLWIPQSGAGGCSTGLINNAQATATTSSANHEKVVYRWCSTPLCLSYYTKGYHYFKGATIQSTNGNTVNAGDCGGTYCSPCTPGFIEGGACAAAQQDVCGCCPDPCPLAIDRNRDGLRFSSAYDGVLFDINGRGTTFWLGWPTGPDDAWLAMDRNGNGAIDDGSELFGNTRNLASGVNAKHGYEVLAELDENGDGRVDASDPEFSKLLLWTDTNRNGVSEPTELSFVAKAGVRSLGLSYRESARRDKWGNRFKYIAFDRTSVDVFPVWELPDSHKEDQNPPKP